MFKVRSKWAGEQIAGRSRVAFDVGRRGKRGWDPVRNGLRSKGPGHESRGSIQLGLELRFPATIVPSVALAPLQVASHSVLAKKPASAGTKALHHLYSMYLYYGIELTGCSYW